jgi:hypothetical protein
MLPRRRRNWVFDPFYAGFGRRGHVGGLRTAGRERRGVIVHDSVCGKYFLSDYIREVM